MKMRRENEKNNLIATVLDKLQSRSYHDPSALALSLPRAIFLGARQVMGNLVVVGAQWGDEGKGKIVDMLAEQARVVMT